MRKTGRGRIAKEILEMLCIFLIAGGFVFLIVNLVLDYRSKKALEDIRLGIKAARIQSEQIVIPKATDSKDGQGPVIAEAIALDENGKEIVKNDDLESKNKSEPANPILEEYEKLLSENADFAGWLYVEGTEIDYPYMQGPDNAFYLSHNIERTYDKYGMLVMDVNCSDRYESPQYIIYGHNVNNGSLFGDLLKFKEEAYYKYHPQLCFDSVSEMGLYDIFAVFLTSVDEAQKEESLFTTWGFEDKKRFDEVTGWAIGKSLYNTGIIPEYGKPIVSLVTCEHSKDEGRFVVMATKRE